MNIIIVIVVEEEDVRNFLKNNDNKKGGSRLKIKRKHILSLKKINDAKLLRCFSYKCCCRNSKERDITN